MRGKITAAAYEKKAELVAFIEEAIVKGAALAGVVYPEGWPRERANNMAQSVLGWIDELEEVV